MKKCGKLLSTLLALAILAGMLPVYAAESGYNGQSGAVGDFDRSYYDATVEMYQLLSKGGSGDVLAGLVCALLAQGYPPPEAAWNASLAHTLAAREVYAPWGIPPQALIEAVRGLPLSAAKAADKV